jgi:hypothetical protein
MTPGWDWRSCSKRPYSGSLLLWFPMPIALPGPPSFFRSLTLRCFKYFAGTLHHTSLAGCSPVIALHLLDSLNLCMRRGFLVCPAD